MLECYVLLAKWHQTIVKCGAIDPGEAGQGGQAMLPSLGVLVSQPNPHIWQFRF